MAVDINDLIRAYEPVLYFAEGERFYPSDCKRYLERCSLWNAVPPFDDRASWREGGVSGPVINQTISGNSSEPGTFLGENQGGTFPYLYASGPNEGFLDLAGWTDGKWVAPASENRFADLDEVDRMYNVPASADPILEGSRFWYHAEAFDLPRLRGLMGSDGAPAHFKGLLPTLLEPRRLGDPLLICYYLFFPGHDEPLEDCGSSVETALFGSFAGEWACVAILFKCRPESTPPGGSPSVDECVPVSIGLTSRNAGEFGFMGGERRVGMRVYEWNDIRTAPRDRGAGKAKGDHPRLFVARGTHGLYPSPGFPGVTNGLLVPEFSPEDTGKRHCGAAELLDKSLEDLDDEAEEAADDTWVDDAEIFWTKFFALGALWALIEWSAGGGGGLHAVASRTPEQYDHPPLRDAPGYFGSIVHPAGLMPPNGEDTPLKFAWQSLSNEPALETTAGGKTYSIRVDRTQQIWWPGMEGRAGFAGRWGSRVARDPYTRRAGMKFPEFWEMFMTAFAKSKS